MKGIIIKANFDGRVYDVRYPLVEGSSNEQVALAAEHVLTSLKLHVVQDILNNEFKAGS